MQIVNYLVNSCQASRRVIRELTANVLRHGGAKNVKIAGSLEDGELRFSVADDGCGFDPAMRPMASAAPKPSPSRYESIC